MPLGTWLYAIYLMCTSKKDVSAAQLQRELNVTYKTAWFMCHRVRHVMSKSPCAAPMGSQGGIVEVDETYVGGKVANRHKGKICPDKEIVVALIDREDEVRTFHVPDATARTLKSPVALNVDRTDHHLSAQYLHRYLRNYVFKWNLRKATDRERMVRAKQGAPGKRLMYHEPVKDRPHRFELSERSKKLTERNAKKRPRDTLT